jgi:hypothetical protein
LPDITEKISALTTCHNWPTGAVGFAQNLAALTAVGAIN